MEDKKIIGSISELLDEWKECLKALDGVLDDSANKIYAAKKSIKHLNNTLEQVRRQVKNSVEPELFDNQQ